MSTFRIRCPHCAADVVLRPVQLILARDTTGQRSATCTMACSRCGAVTVRPVARAAERLLRGGGVTPINLASGHPERPPGGPPLSRDDALDFHLLLNDREWFDVLQASERRHHGERCSPADRSGGSA